MAVMVVPGLEIRLGRADKEPLQKQTTWPRSAVTGSVVGIQIEVLGMYTGTLISDLMMAAERVGRMLEQKRMDEELHEIFTMQIPLGDGEQAYMGAA